MLVLLLLVQSGNPGTFGASNEPRAADALRTNVERLQAQFSDGQYDAVIARGPELLSATRRAKRKDLEVKVRRALGSAYVAVSSYRLGLETLLPGRKPAADQKQFADLASLNNAIAWIYGKMHNLKEAAYFSDEAMEAARLSGKFSLKVAVSRAFIYSLMGDYPHAEGLYQEVINRSLDSGDGKDVKTAATAWHFLGLSYFYFGKLPEAEWAETEAFRLTKLHHLTEGDTIDCDLALTLSERGDYRTADVLMNEAIEMAADPQWNSPVWAFFRDRGRLRAEEGDLNGAFADLKTALEHVRRLEIIPTDDDRVVFESSDAFGSAGVTSLFVDIGNRLYKRTHDARLKEEVFEAAEEGRAASLLALVPKPNGWRTKLPPEHARALERLDAAEKALLIHPGGQTESEVQALRTTLHQIEAASGVDQTIPGSAMERAERALDADTAIVAFRLGTERSWVWAFTAGMFEVYELPGSGAIKADLAAFRAAIAQNPKEVQSTGERLSRELLGPLPQTVHDKHRWIVALDQDLFDLPLPALSWGGEYLARSHAFVITPSVHLLEEAGSELPIRGPLFAIGDAIYNRADPRWRGANAEPAGLFGWIRPTGTPESLSLGRLSASASEARTAVEIWRSGEAILGKDATRESLNRALAAQPAILHLATHVIPARDDRAGVIVLGLGKSGEPDVVTMRDILLAPVSSRLVVMSGCASGDAKALPATGLMGLTRAWLGAGASQVLATRWPMLDDSGPFFSSFYRHLSEAPDGGAPEALRRAQIEMIDSKTFRASPEYWASYFLVGKV